MPHVAAFWPEIGTQAPALQHPVGQLVASHWQAPPTQRWPAAQATFVPHPQTPPAQLSALAPHMEQVAPRLPHEATVGGLTQVVPLQHPPGQLPAEHSHLAFLHSCPAPQAAPLPHLQAPPPQLSEVNGSQVVQAAPAVPQLETEGTVQTPFLQQPLAQLIAEQPVQAPLLQAWVPGHAWHARPPLPQAVV